MAIYIRLEGDADHEVLLSTAEGLLEAGYFDPAVVTAQTACELATEFAMLFGFKKHQISELEEPIVDLFASFNLGNQRLLRLYVALTGDQINKEPFWADFKAHAQRRHKVAHQGHRSTQSEAQASVAVARQFVNHIHRTLPIAKLGPATWE